ncbi:hereditary hemochromatosis protein homolog [Alosa sapidissima]|uniref:hereditary hemochromatosis protein homolog n=1 Tax=Alosa sapidissima TaxID=34773 RepID=UPI001C08AED7|nr:hereditary hemochromatosis protein homolog [Alosa sapidissima]
MMFLFEASGSSATALWMYLLLISSTFSKGSDVDTLEVQYTVHHGPGGKLQFQQTTLFNGHVIFACSSPTLRDQPQQHWVTNAFTQEGLEERHEQCKSQCYEHFASFEKIKQTITVSADIFQRRRGCIINSSERFAFDKWGVNGEDFLTFDPDALKWTAQSDEANPLASEWDGEYHMNNAYKDFGNILYYLVPILKMHLPARPSDDAHAGMELHIFGKHIPGGTVSYLQCLVADYSLSGVSSQLTKDGVPLDHGVYQTGPRPNGDGTVQMRVQVKTTMDNSKTYRCEVHSETFNKSVIFDDQSTHQSTVIGDFEYAVIGTVACVIVLVVVICCLWWRQRHWRQLHKTNSPEDGTLSQKSQEEKKKVKYKTDGSSSSESTQRLNASTSEGKNKRVTALTKFPVEMAT